MIAAAPGTGADEPSDRHWLLVVVGFAVAKLVVHLATSSGYGYFRDELYYLACTDHLQAGYVDHPPLSIAVLWVVRHTLGESRPALRLVPALLGAATVALVGLTSRALGGGRWAGVLAMTGALVAPIHLSLSHYYSMNAFDVALWALAGYLLVRLVERPGPRNFLLLGLIVGLGLLNKLSVLWLGGGIAVALVLTPQRRWLRTPWPWAAAVLAGALFAPHLVWQVRHGWPTLEFIRNATTQKMLPVSPLAFLATQATVMLPLNVPLLVGGLVFLFHPAGKRHRLLGWTYLTVVGILILSRSTRSTYLAAANNWLLAAGGVAAERWFAGRGRWLKPALLAVLVAGGALAAPLALPILPVSSLLRYTRALGQRPATEERNGIGDLDQFFADMQGWDAIVTTIDRTYEALPPAERAVARVFAPDYGVAGAVDVLGRRLGLPPALSGHNSYWLWGPGDSRGEVIISVGGSEDLLRASFERVERAGTIECGRCMPYENHRPIFVGRQRRRPLADVWPLLKHYD